MVVSEIQLRSATIKDESLLFKWRNIDDLVALSYHQKKVTLSEHQQWFKRNLLSSDCELFIIQLDNQDIGLIRIEAVQAECEITIYLIPGNEGRGFGYSALSQALEDNSIRCNVYIAKVQVKNIPSQNLFKKLEFFDTFRDNSFILYKKPYILV